MVTDGTSIPGTTPLRPEMTAAEWLGVRRILGACRAASYDEMNAVISRFDEALKQSLPAHAQETTE